MSPTQEILKGLRRGTYVAMTADATDARRMREEIESHDDLTMAWNEVVGMLTTHTHQNTPTMSQQAK